MAVKLKKLEDGTIRIERDDGSIFYKDTSGKITDSSGKRIDITGSVGAGFLKFPFAKQPSAPIEDYLPTVAGGIGATVGSFAPLPPPLGTITGAGAFTPIGVAGKNLIKMVRGKPIPKNAEEASKEVAWETGKNVFFESLFGGTGKVWKLFKGKATFEGGIDAFKNKIIKEVLAPDEKLENQASALLSKYASKPATKKLESKKLIDEIFERKEYSTNIGGTLTEEQSKNLAHLTPIQKAALLRPEGAELPKPKIIPAIVGEKTTTFQPMAVITNELDNPQLTYGRLKRLQEIAGKYANFSSANKSVEERTFGKLYHTLGQDLQRTAKEGKFISSHNKIFEEGRKYHQRYFLTNIFQESRKYPEGTTDFKLLFNNLKIPDEELSTIFQDNYGLVRTLRDLSALHTKTYGGKEAFRTYAIPQAGRVGVVVHPDTLMQKLTPLETRIKGVLGKGLDLQQQEKYGEMVFPSQWLERELPLKTRMVGTGLRLGQMEED